MIVVNDRSKWWPWISRLGVYDRSRFWLWSEVWWMNWCLVVDQKWGGRQWKDGGWTCNATNWYLAGRKCSSDLGWGVEKSKEMDTRKAGRWSFGRNGSSSGWMMQCGLGGWNYSGTGKKWGKKSNGVMCIGLYGGEWIQVV